MYKLTLFLANNSRTKIKISCFITKNFYKLIIKNREFCTYKLLLKAINKMLREMVI